MDKLDFTKLIYLKIDKTKYWEIKLDSKRPLTTERAGLLTKNDLEHPTKVIFIHINL
jgi:hypothetical protein